MVTDSLSHAPVRIAIGLAAIFLLTDCAEPTSPSVVDPARTGRPEITLPRGDVVAEAQLRTKLAMLSPSVRVDEAERLAQCAYMTSRQLAREYRVVFPPALNNILINTGARKRGLCYQWTEDLLHQLDALKLETLELHWGEAFARTFSETRGVCTGDRFIKIRRNMNGRKTRRSTIVSSKQKPRSKRRLQSIAGEVKS